MPPSALQATSAASGRDTHASNGRRTLATGGPACAGGRRAVQCLEAVWRRSGVFPARHALKACTAARHRGTDHVMSDARSMTPRLPEPKLLIDGESVAPEGGTIPVTNP